MLRKFLRFLVSSVLLVVVGVVRSWRAPRARASTAPSRRGLSEAGVAPPPYRDSAVPPDFARLLLSWSSLLLLGCVEFAVSFLPMDRSLRPLVMLPGVLMVAVVAISFMEVGKGPAIVRGFAVAAMFWLIVLLGLGSMDPLTRTNYLVRGAHVE